MNTSNKPQDDIKSATETLLKTLEQNPEIWSIRKEAARLLFDHGSYREAADLVWSAPEIPAVDLEIAFTARVLSRAQPQRAIRLLQHVMERTSESPAKLLAIANALMHHGMVMQAARFYGAATACDRSLANGDLEHFMLWIDDSQRLWGSWPEADQKMGELPWVKRDQAKEGNYEKMMKGLTTPISVPGLKESTAEHLLNEYYRQVPIKDGEISAPPAVTVPLDQLNPNDVLHDDVMGAAPTPARGEAVAKVRSPHAPGSVNPAEMTPVKMTLPAAGKVPSVVSEKLDEAPKKPKFLF